MNKNLVNKLAFPLVSNGDTISWDAPYSAIDRLQRQALLAILPLQGLSLDCNRPFLRKEVEV